MQIFTRQADKTFYCKTSQIFSRGTLTTALQISTIVELPIWMLNEKAGRLFNRESNLFQELGGEHFLREQQYTTDELHLISRSTDKLCHQVQLTDTSLCSELGLHDNYDYWGFKNTSYPNCFNQFSGDMGKNKKD